MNSCIVRLSAAIASFLLCATVAEAAVKFSFTQNVGTGNQLFGALADPGSPAASGRTPVTFDFTIGPALSADTAYDFSVPGLTFSGFPSKLAGPVLDFNASAGTPISSFALSQFTAAYPGLNQTYYGHLLLRTDVKGAVVQYSVNISAISSYVGPLTAAFATPTNFQFTAESQTAVTDARLLVGVLNSSRAGTADFGDLICTTQGQGCGTSYTIASVPGTIGGGTGGLTAVPEPVSLGLLGFGLLGMAGRRWSYRTR